MVIKKKYLYVLLSLLYFELIFNLFTYDSYLRSSIINISLFCLVNSFLIFILTSVWNEKWNRVITYVIYVLFGLWYSLHYVFYNLLQSPFSIALFGLTDQALGFSKNAITEIFANFHMILLFFMPLILFVIFRKREVFKVKLEGKKILVAVSLFVMSVGIYVSNIFIQDRGAGSIYNLYMEANNVSLNIERLGVMSATMLDVFRSVFGYDERILEVNLEEETSDELFQYEYNKTVEQVDDSTGNIKKINDYVMSDTGTRKNKYTGMFKGKNLIFVVAESFSEIAVSEELTPTLYKLVNSGFQFKNFYTSNNLSTIGGEFQALTGLYADNSILSSWRGGKRYFPYGLGTMFGDNGYKTFAYHNNSAYFQDRNVYLKSQGFDNFKGCYNGLEKIINCEVWPQSDVEMINGTYMDYINSEEPFLAYYMTVSGHYYYTFSGNAMALKNREFVDDLDYNENIRAYLATQIELDRAMKSLIEKLEDAGKLDDTVIVMVADHFPYYLKMDDINRLSGYERDAIIEANSNSLIIYNSEMDDVVIDKTSMSIDVLPTVLNLFGMEYDSRFLMGKDILSTEPGLAMFRDKSWVTDKGVYFASTGEFKSYEEVDDEYVENINNIVNNRTAISRMIVDSDYYRKIFGE